MHSSHLFPSGNYRISLSHDQWAPRHWKWTERKWCTCWNHPSSCKCYFTVIFWGQWWI